MAIESDKVKRAVYNRIDFELPDEVWGEISKAFGICWNEVIGFGNDVYEDEVINYIATWLQKKKVLLLKSQLTRILDIMFDYISMIGGFWDESKPFLPKRVVHKSEEMGEEKSACYPKKRVRVRTILRIADEIKRQMECEYLNESQEDKMWVAHAAANLAKELHKGQVDKAGKDYFEGHLWTVGCSGSNWKEKTVGFLHDALEDTDYEIQEIMLGLMRISDGWEILPTEDEWKEIEEALNLMNSRTAPNREAYIERFRGYSLAIRVKLNDLRHNMDISRISQPNEKDLERVKRYEEEYDSLKQMLKDKSFKR